MSHRLITLTIAAVGLCAPMAQAGLSATGDVIPANPATWTTFTDGYIGKTGWGSVTVDNNSDLLSFHGYVGDGFGSTGVVIVSGAGSTWTNSSGLYVGYDGSGTVNIAAGGAVSSYTGRIGYRPDSTGVVTVSGQGSTWTTASAFWVAYFGSGTLDITDGGAVINSRAYIGNSSGSTGVVTVSGPGSTWTNSGGLYVADFGSGTLDITAGGAVSCKYGYIGTYSASTGVVTVTGPGSTWTNSHGLWVGYDGSGTLRLHDGGTATVGGDAIFYSGTMLEFGLSGALVESYLDVTGLATLAGALDITLLPSLVLTPGAEFLILDAASLAGTFDTVNFPNAQEWSIDYDTVGGDVSVRLLAWSPGNFDGDTDIDADDIDILCDNMGDPAYDLDGDADADVDDLTFLIETLVELQDGSGRVGTRQGDFNLDGFVNATDLAIMKAGFGLSGIGYADGNANCDTVVNATDLAILKLNFGYVAPTGTVPGPATLGLLGLGGLSLLRRRS